MLSLTAAPKYMPIGMHNSHVLGVSTVLSGSLQRGGWLFLCAWSEGTEVASLWENKAHNCAWKCSGGRYSPCTETSQEACSRAKESAEIQSSACGRRWETSKKV